MERDERRRGLGPAASVYPAAAPDEHDNVAEGVLVVDQAGRIQYANAMAQETIGHRSGDLVGQRFGFPLDVESGVQKIEVRGRDGAFRAAEMRITPVRAGGVRGWVVAIVDVAAKTTSEQFLLESLRARDDALAVASHEMVNSLAVAGLAVEALHDQWEELPAPARMENLSLIRRHLSRMGTIVTGYLAAVRADAGMFTPTPSSTDVKDVLLERIGEFGKRAADIDLVIPDGMAVSASADHVWTILSNFLTNAFKYGAPPVQVCAQAGDGWVEVAVSDQGKGIPDDQVSTIFDRYRRGDDEQAAPGTGLGLWIARTLARAYGGDVQYGPALPHGSRFSVRLPLPGHRIAAGSGAAAGPG